jgi:hypothetical protein
VVLVLERGQAHSFWVAEIIVRGEERSEVKGRG